jgi:rfaE bifunctional protein nucleotidyltransferase chain/domain
MQNKIKTLAALKNEVFKLKREKKRIVFTNGCFDLLHLGHIKVFRQAKKYGDVLIVGLNSDSSINKIKGPQRPILDQKSRAQLIAALEVVDYVVIFYEATPYNVVKTLKPDVLVKGGDWGKNQISGYDLVKKVVRIKLYPGYSTTKIIEKILNLYGNKK